MKKVIKNISRVLFSLLLIFSIFSIVNVLAEEAIFQITNISVKEKSDKVTVNDVSISGGELKNDIVFTDLNDYIKYDITIKNVSGDTYTIKSISDNNNSEYLEYTYDDLSNVKLNSSEEKTFELQIKYIQETSNLTISDQAVSLTLTYEKEDGTTGSEVITNNSNNDSSSVTNNISNPKTGDNITIYLLLGIISLIGLCVTTVNRRYLNKSLMSIAVLSMIVIPFGVKADSDKFIISFTTNKIRNSYIDIGDGIEFHTKLLRAALNNDKIERECFTEDDETYCGYVDTNYTEDDFEYWEYDTDSLVHIKPGTIDQFNAVKDTISSSRIISPELSNVHLYLWSEDDTVYYYTNAKKIVLSGDITGLFAELYSLEDIDISNFDTSNVTNMSELFNYDSNLTTITGLNNFDTSKVTDMSRMFSGCSSLESVDLSSFNTSKVTDMSGMFIGCSSLESVNLSSFNTSKVIDMSNMFSDCNVITNLDVSKFDTSKVTNMRGMFSCTYNLSTLVGLNKFVTNNVTDMSYMFFGAQSLSSYDVATFNTSKVNNMELMFGGGNESVVSIDLSNFDTKNVKDMSGMFAGARKLKSVNLSSFDTSNVEDFEQMFSGVESIEEIDISNFNTNSATNMGGMFKGCKKLKTIYSSDSFVPKGSDNSIISLKMFYGCTDLVGGAGTTYNSSRISFDYAHIDGGGSNPGYFTDIADKPVNP